MATFADLATLLLTFFVLMLSMANIDIQKFREMLGSVQNAFGVTFEQQGEFQPVLKDAPKKGKEVEKPIPTPQLLANTRIEEAREAAAAVETSRIAAQVQHLVKVNGLERSVEVRAGKRGVRMRVKGGLLFEPGQATLKPSSYRLLDGIIKVLAKSKFYLIVEGHTDNVPIKTATFPSNWELSAARATAVVRYIANKGGIDPKRLSAIGFGPNYPISPNNTPAGRASNRRVEFIFTKLTPRVAVR